jgi:hypothetical protein
VSDTELVPIAQAQQFSFVVPDAALRRDDALDCRDPLAASAGIGGYCEKTT